jgi:hypothetical protein
LRLYQHNCGVTVENVARSTQLVVTINTQVSSYVNRSPLIFINNLVAGSASHGRPRNQWHQ